MTNCKEGSNIEIVHEVAIITLDVVLKFFFSEIIDHIVFISFECSYNSCELFLIDVNRYCKQTGLRLHKSIKMCNCSFVAFNDPAYLRNAELASFHLQNNDPANALRP